MLSLTLFDHLSNITLLLIEPLFLMRPLPLSTSSSDRRRSRERCHFILKSIYENIPYKMPKPRLSSSSINTKKIIYNSFSSRWTNCRVIMPMLLYPRFDRSYFLFYSIQHCLVDATARIDCSITKQLEYIMLKKNMYSFGGKCKKKIIFAIFVFDRIIFESNLKDQYC